MPRWACQRDKNEMGIFDALVSAGAQPIRGRDTDIYAWHSAGHGVMLEVKTKKGTLQPIQVELQAMFGDRYHVVRSEEDALRAVGRLA